MGTTPATAREVSTDQGTRMQKKSTKLKRQLSTRCRNSTSQMAATTRNGKVKENIKQFRVCPWEQGNRSENKLKAGTSNGTRGKRTKEKHINSRTTLDLACHARDAQAQERPEVPTRANRNRDSRMTRLGPVQTCRADQTRHPTSAHEAPSSPSIQGKLSGSKGRATGKKP